MGPVRDLSKYHHLGGRQLLWFWKSTYSDLCWGSSKNLLETQGIFEQDPVKRLDGEARLLQMHDYVSR